jgi:hypothetical protein
LQRHHADRYEHGENVYHRRPPFIVYA